MKFCALTISTQLIVTSITCKVKVSTLLDFAFHHNEKQIAIISKDTRGVVQVGMRVDTQCRSGAFGFRIRLVPLHTILLGIVITPSILCIVIVIFSPRATIHLFRHVAQSRCQSLIVCVILQLRNRQRLLCCSTSGISKEITESFCYSISYNIICANLIVKYFVDSSLVKSSICYSPLRTVITYMCPTEDFVVMSTSYVGIHIIPSLIFATENIIRTCFAQHKIRIRSYIVYQQPLSIFSLRLKIPPITQILETEVSRSVFSCNNPQLVVIRLINRSYASDEF